MLFVARNQQGEEKAPVPENVLKGGARTQRKATVNLCRADRIPLLSRAEPPVACGRLVLEAQRKSFTAWLRIGTVQGVPRELVLLLLLYESPVLER